MAIAVATSLKDMISLISSRTLLKDLVEAHIPDSGIPWQQLDKDKGVRASQVHEHLLALRDSRPDEENGLVGALSVVAVLNLDVGNQPYMTKQLQYLPNLNTAFQFYPFQCPNAHSVANVAAWINMKSLTDAAAKDIWEELVGVAQTQQQKNNQWRIFDITTPKKKQTEYLEGIAEFQRDFKTFEEKKGTSDDFDSEVFPSTLDRCIRYIINTTKPLREVKMREKDASGKATWRTGKDNHQTGFIIDHYFLRDYIAISRVVSADEKEIAQLFLRDVLGAEIIEQEKKAYDLMPFATAESKKFLRLPAKMEKQGEHIWISGMEVAVSDNTPSVFPKVKLKNCQFSEKDDIHAFLGKLLHEDLHIVDVLKITITLQLRKRQFIMDKWMLATKEQGFNEYVFTLSPTSFSSNPKLINIKDNFDFKFIKDHRAEWHLEGETPKGRGKKKAATENNA